MQSHPLDSSVEFDQYSMTDSSSYISDQSSISLGSKDRSCSNDPLRKSFDSQSYDYPYSSYYDISRNVKPAFEPINALVSPYKGNT